MRTYQVVASKSGEPDLVLVRGETVGGGTRWRAVQRTASLSGFGRRMARESKRSKIASQLISEGWHLEIVPCE